MYSTRYYSISRKVGSGSSGYCIYWACSPCVGGSRCLVELLCLRLRSSLGAFGSSLDVGFCPPCVERTPCACKRKRSGIGNVGVICRRQVPPAIGGNATQMATAASTLLRNQTIYRVFFCDRRAHGGNFSDAMQLTLSSKSSRKASVAVLIVAHAAGFPF